MLLEKMCPERPTICSICSFNSPDLDGYQGTRENKKNVPRYVYPSTTPPKRRPNHWDLKGRIAGGGNRFLPGGERGKEVAGGQEDGVELMVKRLPFHLGCLTIFEQGE
jgi:hypothetical protein